MSNSRQHWHARAIELAQLDCSLLEMVPDHDRNLTMLRTDVYTLVLKTLDALTGDACRMEADGMSASDIEETLAKAIWNFIKPWKGSTTVPRETPNTPHQTQKVTPCSN